MTADHEEPVIFTPDNEPYLGRETLHALDKIIIACLERNSTVAQHTFAVTKTDMQWAACQLIPQGVSIGLSIRELVRQGYLFGALTLVRPLVERAAILLYLKKNPSEIEKWKRGWLHNEAPSLAKMLDNIGSDKLPNLGKEVTRPMNSITHGKPDCAVWSIVPVGNDAVGHGVSKILNNPALCDEVCLQTEIWFAVLMGMMNAYFPNA